MKIFLSFILFSISIVSFGQEKEPTADQLAFDEILEIYYDEEYDSALTLCQTFLQEYPNSNLISRVKYNIGYILRELERDKEAIPIFKDLLESKYDEKERFGGLMEQYTLFKHRSASNLADIYLGLEEFEQAKKYIRLFDKKYKYQHFGGNEMMANEIYTAQQYARLYHGQGKTEKGIKQLLPYVFDNGLASNTSLLKLLDELMNEHYSEEEIKNLVSQSKTTLKIINSDKATVEFLNTKIDVFDYQLFALGAVDYQENLELVGQQKWDKVFRTNDFFGKYLK